MWWGVKVGVRVGDANLHVISAVVKNSNKSVVVAMTTHARK